MQTVLNPEQDLITRPDPPFSPALPRVSCRRSQSASTCISCAVILGPWMLRLQFPPSHILSLFPGFMQASLILSCAGLFEVCLFLSTDSHPEESSSDTSPPQLCLSPTSAAETGHPKLNPCPHLVSRLPLSHIHNPPDTRAAKTTERTAMISANFLISQPFCPSRCVCYFFSPPSPPP